MRSIARELEGSGSAIAQAGRDVFVEKKLRRLVDKAPRIKLFFEERRDACEEIYQMKLERGDVIQLTFNKVDAPLEIREKIVSSIDPDGNVHFVGGGMTTAHQLLQCSPLKVGKKQLPPLRIKRF